MGTNFNFVMSSVVLSYRFLSFNINIARKKCLYLFAPYSSTNYIHVLMGSQVGFVQQTLGSVFRPGYCCQKKKKTI